MEQPVLNTGQTMGRGTLRYPYSVGSHEMLRLVKWTGDEERPQISSPLIHRMITPRTLLSNFDVIVIPEISSHPLHVVSQLQLQVGLCEVGEATGDLAQLLWLKLYTFDTFDTFHPGMHLVTAFGRQEKLNFDAVVIASGRLGVMLTDAIL